MSRAPALVASALLHAGLLGALMFWPERVEPPPPPPVPVKLIPPPPDGPQEVSTAPEPSPEPPAPVAEPEPTPAEAPPPPPAPAPPQPAPPQPTPSRPTPPAPRPTPPRPAPTPRPAPAKPSPPKPAPPRPTPPKPAPPRPTPPRPTEDSVDLSALGQRLARNQPARAAKPAGASPGQIAAARADLASRLATLWRPNCGIGGDALATNVTVRFRLSGGRVEGSPQVLGGDGGDAVVQAAQERALRAVRAAAPYDWLPEEMQDQSHTVNFNARRACPSD